VQPVAENVEERVELQPLVQDDARLALIAAQQGVEDEHRVALTGVAAQHDRGAPARRERLLGVRGPADVHPHAGKPGDRAVDPADEPAQHLVVRALRAHRVAAQAPGDPQAQARQRRGEVQRGPRHHDRDCAQRPPGTAGQRRRNRGDQREQRRRDDDRELRKHDERRDDDPPDERRRHEHQDKPRSCDSR
jgi:hypothetical protein